MKEPVGADLQEAIPAVGAGNGERILDGAGSDEVKGIAEHHEEGEEGAVGVEIPDRLAPIRRTRQPEVGEHYSTRFLYVPQSATTMSITSTGNSSWGQRDNNILSKFSRKCQGLEESAKSNCHGLGLERFGS